MKDITPEMALDAYDSELALLNQKIAVLKADVEKQEKQLATPMVEMIARMSKRNRNHFIMELVTKWPHLAQDIADDINCCLIDEDSPQEIASV
tara:strand:- start:757 stop:1035 length:279 start_codon:yes stop_codon:yes gene_type:complete